MRLGTLLLRDAVISLNQLEDALRAQVLYGGRLGTNLVELGSLDLDLLGTYLSKVYGVPVATAARMEAADPAAAARLGPGLASRVCAFPLGPEPLRPDAIAVAMAEPEPHLVDAVAERMGCVVVPYVAAELRILYYLENRLGIPRRPRFLRPSDAAGAAPGAPERRASPPALAESPAIVRPQARARRDGPRPARSAAPRVVFADAAEAIASADRRDAIADQIIAMAPGRTGAAALFLVRGQNAIGWRAFGGPGRLLAATAIENLSVPLVGSSVLQIAYDTQRPYHGPSPAAGRPVERQVWLALGVIDPPADMLVVPVSVGHRVVNLIYAHGPGGGSIAEAHARELIDLGRAAASSYVRLIQSSRQDKPGAT